MSGVSNTERSRGYRPHFAVQYRGSQRQRFGAEHRDDIRGMLEVNDTEDYPDGFTGEWSDFPRVARLRMNLTALSQHYNMYFVAYQGYVHVHRPNRTPATILDGPPLAILDPEESKTPMSRFTPGHVNRRCPHEVNHMIVGDLGDKEILLLSRDNGDVAAWYTHEIARLVEDRMLHLEDDVAKKKAAPARPRHFFADNVGVSAWGLAIHTNSRLIAVSANTSEVTVFAFALDDAEDEGDERDGREEEAVAAAANASSDQPPYGHDAAEVVSIKEQNRGEGLDPVNTHNMLPKHLVGLYPRAWRSKQSDCEAIAKLEARFWKRQRTWRIVIPLGVDASNLPGVAFCDDEQGYADRVAAIDINGNIFIADLWRIGTKLVKIPSHNVQDLKGRRWTQLSGWNILPIMDAQLRPTKTLRAAIGMPPRKAVYRGKTKRGAWLDISRCMVELSNDAASFGHRDRYDSFEPIDFSTDKDGISPPNPHLPHPQLSESIQLSKKVYQPQFDKNDKLDLGGDRPVRITMTMVPVTGDHFCEFRSAQAQVDFAAGEPCTRRALRMPKALSLMDYRYERGFTPEGQHLLNGISFLRAYEEGVEIMSLDRKEDSCGVVCHHVLTNVNLYRQRTYWDMQFGKRCSMLLTIPDLNLVVLGSMCGRVTLLTLTQPPQKSDSSPSRTHPRRAFRVEAVLPFEAEERARERPYVCLLGMAVSPVPDTTAQGLELRKRRPSVYGGRRRSEKLPDTEIAAPNRWRLILNYMDHTILQYDILRRHDDEGGDGGLNVEKSHLRRRRRRHTSSTSSSQDDRREGEDQDDEDFEYAYFSDYDPDGPLTKGDSRSHWADVEESTEDEEEESENEVTVWGGLPDNDEHEEEEDEDEDEDDDDDDDDDEDEEGDESNEDENGNEDEN